MIHSYTFKQNQPSCVEVKSTVERIPVTSLNLIETSPLSEVTIESEVTESMLPDHEHQTEFVIEDTPVSTVHHLLLTLSSQAMIMISPH